MNSSTEIVEFDDAAHREQVVDLWKSVFGYEAEHNIPEKVIAEKVGHGDGLFFVAMKQGVVIGTVMVGYDGHRGWVYSLAVCPGHGKQGVGSSLLSFAQNKLADLGCRKINLQIMEGNEAVKDFYIAKYPVTNADYRDRHRFGTIACGDSIGHSILSPSHRAATGSRLRS